MENENQEPPQQLDPKQVYIMKSRETETLERDIRNLQEQVTRLQNSHSIELERVKSQERIELENMKFKYEQKEKDDEVRRQIDADIRVRKAQASERRYAFHTTVMIVIGGLAFMCIILLGGHYYGYWR